MLARYKVRADFLQEYLRIGWFQAKVFKQKSFDLVAAKDRQTSQHSRIDRLDQSACSHSEHTNYQASQNPSIEGEIQYPEE